MELPMFPVEIEHKIYRNLHAMGMKDVLTEFTSFSSHAIDCFADGENHRDIEDYVQTLEGKMKHHIRNYSFVLTKMALVYWLEQYCVFDGDEDEDEDEIQDEKASVLLDKNDFKGVLTFIEEYDLLSEDYENQSVIYPLLTRLIDLKK